VHFSKFEGGSGPICATSESVATVPILPGKIRKRQTSLSITFHHLPSLSNTFHHFASLSITYHQLPSLSNTYNQ
jgi:hypothetical protein